MAKGAGYDLVGYEQIIPIIERGEGVKGHLFQFVFEGVTTSHVDGGEL